MPYVLKTAPTVEPITAPELKAHLRVDHADEDTYINTLIVAARLRAELHLRRQLITATWTLYLDEFPSGSTELKIAKPPLISITDIKYLDTADTLQTLAKSTYIVDIKTEPGRVVPEYGLTWPTTRDEVNAIQIEFQAGYGAEAAKVPQAIRQAVMMLAAHWYENREIVTEGRTVSPIPESAFSLLDQYRVFEFV